MLTAALPGGALADGWTLVPSANQEEPGGTLAATSCWAKDTCMSVGAEINGAGVRAPLAETRAGATWSVVPAPEPAGAEQGAFSGVSCIGAAACTAVGFYRTSLGAIDTLIERWNGASWSIKASPSPAGDDTLLAVSCPAADACVAVGASGGMPLAEAWNGSTWSVQRSPAVKTSSTLNGVSCTSSRYCVAVGSVGLGTPSQGLLAELWNGSSWTTQAVPAADSPQAQLDAVACPSTTTCLAVGMEYTNNANNPYQGVARFWNGTSWTANAGGGGDSISCPGVRDCTSVEYPLGGSSYAAHWDGSSWTAESSPTGDVSHQEALAAVSCSGVDACTAVGETNVGGSDQSVARYQVLGEGFDGSRWSLAPAVSPPGAVNSFLAGVSCSAADACTAVGSGLISRWDGNDWDPQAPAPVSGGGLPSFNAVSCSGAQTCMALGGDVAEAWDGRQWSVKPTPPPPSSGSSEPSGLSCPSAAFCIAVGEVTGNPQRPLLEHWTGSGWVADKAPQPAGSSSAWLGGVSCTAADACTAVGGYLTSKQVTLPFAAQFNGATWTLHAVPVPASLTQAWLNGVSCSTADACTAVGGSDATAGFAERWNGTRWSPQTTPSPSTSSSSISLKSVACLTVAHCTAVGQQAISHPSSQTFVNVAEVWDGTTWTTQPVPTPPSRLQDESSKGGAGLLSVSCASSQECWSVGDYSSLDNVAVTLAEHYTAAPATPPSVSSITPTSGPVDGGTTVTITGSGFSAATAVRFGSAAATSFTVHSDTDITAVAPAGAAGTVDVTVTGPSGTSALGAGDRFTRVGGPLPGGGGGATGGTGGTGGGGTGGPTGGGPTTGGPGPTIGTRRGPGGDPFRVAFGALTGVTGPRPRLALTITGHGDTIERISITAPHGIGFARVRRLLTRDIAARGAQGQRLRFSVRRARGSLSITLTHPVAPVELSVAGAALRFSSAMGWRARRTLSFSVSVTDAQGRIDRLRVQLRAR